MEGCPLKVGQTLKTKPLEEFHRGCPTPGPPCNWWNQYFSGNNFSPISNGANPVHLLQLVPELFHLEGGTSEMALVVSSSRVPGPGPVSDSVEPMLF